MFKSISLILEAFKNEKEREKQRMNEMLRDIKAMLYHKIEEDHKKYKRVVMHTEVEAEANERLKEVIRSPKDIRRVYKNLIDRKIREMEKPEEIQLSQNSQNAEWSTAPSHHA